MAHTKDKITIIDYGMGNIGSICNIIKKAGADYIVTNKTSEIIQSNKIILPGVGAFDEGIKNLKRNNLLEAIKESISSGDTYLLGICLGMQLLLEKSQEGDLDGLGLIKGEVIRFKPANVHDKVPHMGWNNINVLQNNPLVDVNDINRFYFVHSYYAKCSQAFNSVAKTRYINDFDSIIMSDKIFGVQFHPEKSHKFGLRLIQKFILI